MTKWSPEHKDWGMKTMIFLLSLSLSGVILGMIVAFLSWGTGKLIVLSSIGLLVTTALLGDVFELVDYFFEGRKKSRARD